MVSELRSESEADNDVKHLTLLQNLYSCGKVCLSLLGTWSGGKGEGWDSIASSMIQASPHQEHHDLPVKYDGQSSLAVVCASIHVLL